MTLCTLGVTWTGWYNKIPSKRRFRPRCFNIGILIQGGKFSRTIIFLTSPWFIRDHRPQQGQTLKDSTILSARVCISYYFLLLLIVSLDEVSHRLRDWHQINSTIPHSFFSFTGRATLTLPAVCWSVLVLANEDDD